MAAEPVKYMVVCDHPDLNRRYFVADIDDNRPIGGTVQTRIHRGSMGTLVTPDNKRGSRKAIPFTCGACNLNASLQETSVPDLLDKIAPHRDALFPREATPVEMLPDLEIGDWFDMLVNGTDAGPSTVVGYDTRYVIGLDTLCRFVSNLR